MNHIQEMMLKLVLQITATGELLFRKVSPKLRDSRGDVPGWVMITLMSMPRLLLVTAPVRTFHHDAETHGSFGH